MKRRFLLTGIGFGILFATLVMLMAQSSPSPQPPAGKAPLTKDQVQTWLMDNGYVMVGQKELADLQEALKAAKSVQKPPLQQKTPAVSSAAVRRITTIQIVNGMGSKEVKDMLVASGLISKDSPFAKIVAERKLEKRIHIGMYTFEGQPSVEAIIEKMTK